MIDFATLQGLTIPEGVVTQIEDASGRVIWMVQSESGEPIVLEVEKITSDTYAGETTYTGESFILLDIYPKTNGTVKITYGGLTKTITDTSGAAEPNAQQVFFGTFNGVSDEIATPASGTLTIEGGYVGVGVSSYLKAKTASNYCSCITAINEWGTMTEIPSNAFRNCYNLIVGEIPEGVVTINSNAFYMTNSSTAMSSGKIVLPSTLQNLYCSAFARPDSVDDWDNFYLQVIEVLTNTPPRIDDSQSVRVKDNILFVVPKDCGEAYRTAEGWSYYASYIAEKGINNFTLNNVTYKVEAGMTWNEWVNSSFNTDGYTTTSATGAVLATNGTEVYIPENGRQCWAYEAIVPSITYGLI